MGRGFFVVFEGIDGSGKTTISSRVAKELRRRGLTVEHVREGGEFASRVTADIRDFTRDARHLALAPIAELLLYAAREAQLWTEATAPALAARQVVIADRFFYTPEVLARDGRGVPGELVHAIGRAAAAGAEPDLVVLVDVDPHIARARRRLSKIETPSTKAPSRKGLSGAALQERIAAGYRAMAAADPRRWLVVDNSDAALDAVVSRLVAVVEEGVRGGTAAAIAAGRDTEPPKRAPRAASTPDEALRALLGWCDARAEREPALAAWFLGGLAGPGVDERREELAWRAPAVTAAGTRGMTDEASWRLRERLAETAPALVARSLARVPGARAETLLGRIVPLAPAAVARALSGRDDEAAWALRERLFEAEPDAVALGLAGVASAPAMHLRGRWLALRGGEESLARPEVASVLASSLAGVDGPEAARLRDAALGAAPVEVLTSLRGLADDRAFALRRAFAERAPKPVMESLALLDHPEAWALREAATGHCKEAIDSISGIDGERAWKMREGALARWPSTVVKSALPLADAARVRELATRALRANPGHLNLWKHASLVALKEAACAVPSP